LFLLSLVPYARALEGWSWNLPPNAVTIAGKRNNVFYVGEPVCLWITSGSAANYAVRDYFGNLVDSGTIADTSFSPHISAPGWYKVYVYGSADQGQPWGNIVGGTTITIIRPDANFPGMPDSFEAGRYLSWNLKGHVTIQVMDIQQGYSTAIVNGLFFDPPATGVTTTSTTSGTTTGSPAPGGPSASFITYDGTTSGNWKGVYGSQGYNIIDDTASYPTYVSVTNLTGLDATWAAPTSDPRALERAGSPTDRIAAAWYTGQSAGNTFGIDVNFKDAAPHQLTLYALDWDNFGPRNETIQLIDPATGNVLDTRNIFSFQPGRYLAWTVQGHIQVVVTNNVQGTNAGISGIFFDPPGTTKAPPPSVAQFVTFDGTTQGNWKGVYGSDGFNVIGNQASYPNYATVIPSIATPSIWAASSGNPRALMKVSGTDRVAAGLCTPPQASSFYTFDVNLTDGQSHKVALYAEDWGSVGPRAETINIIDANSGAVLDTETIGAVNGPQDGLIDELIRGITGMGPQRYPITDASNPDPDIAHIQSEIAVDKQVYTPYDPVRNRVLMMAFPNGPTNLAGVQKVVQTFQNDVKYWEGRNEPNYAYNGAQFVTQELISFYQTVKGVNPSLKVLGPGIVTIGPGYGLGWIQDFLNAGGANYIDAFSFHAYNNVNGDFVLADESLQGLQSLLAQHNASNIELWQTEQGYPSALYGVDEPRLQGRWTMVQMMAFEQFGIPKEHNILWYDVSHGYWDVPDFWENDDYSLDPAAPLMRVWSEELYGTKYSGAFDFGNPGDKMYVGDLFTGANKTVAAFMSQGDPYGQINLTVSSGTSIHCVSAFGTASDLPVTAGQVALPVPELPVYVELQPNQSIAVAPMNWGSNLATQPGVTALASGDGVNPWNSGLPNSIDKIHDGVMRDWYYSQGNNDYPWADDTPYPGNYPAWVELDLPSVQTIDHVVVYANPSWELFGTLLDYDLQYYTGGQWVTIDHVQEPANTYNVYTPNVLCICDSFFSERWIFPHAFAPVTTSKIRLLVNNVTFGGGADQDVANAGYLTGPPCINLRQIEVYNSTGTPATTGSGGTTTTGSSGGGNPSTASAVFVASNRTAGGNWKGVYGADGYNIIDDTINYPSYATVTCTNALNYAWTGSTADPRALQKASSSSDRIAACWYTGQSSFTVDVNLTDSNSHQLTLYAMDWDNFGPRNETIQLIDAGTGLGLDTETISSFQGGEYLAWTVQGHIQVRVTNNVPGVNAVLSGLFFDPAGTGGTTTSGTGGTTTSGTGGTTTSGTGGTTTSGTGGTTTSGTGGTTTSGTGGTTTSGTGGTTTSGTGGTTTSGTGGTTTSGTGGTTTTGSSGASAVFITTDGTSQGSWKGLYGADGFNIINDTASYPTYATVTCTNASNYTWVGSASDPRALQKASSSTDRIAACWYVGQSNFTVDINLTDGNAHQLTLYAVDWDNYGPRAETIQLIDPSNGTVLDTETITSFQPGKYLIWSVRGHIQVIVTNNVPGSNAVLSGLFFDPVAPAGTTTSGTGGTTTSGSTGGTTTSGTGGTTTSGTGGTTTSDTGGTTTSGSSGGTAASFVTLDATTQGNWDAVYGSDGYGVLPATQYYPAYATVSPILTATYTWTSSTADPRALQVMNRVAACWYSTGLNAGSSFGVDVNLKDGQSHRVAIYAVDWDNYGPRSESVQVIDAASGTVLDTESLASFQNGSYLVWDLKGHVTIQVTNLNAGTNSVISGIFFGAPGATPQTFTASSGARFVGADTTTQGNWKSMYGTDGYNVISGAASYPAYAAVAASGASAYAWQPSTMDPRALEVSPAAARPVSAWYTGNTNTYTVDINLTGGLPHKIALYALDWDNFGPRSERIDVIDAKSGTVLDSRSISNFQTGQYLVWTLQGHVQLVVTNLVPGTNALVNGLFFGSTGRN